MEVTAREINMEEGLVIFNGDSCLWPLPRARYAPGDLGTGRFHITINTDSVDIIGLTCLPLGRKKESIVPVHSEKRVSSDFIDHRPL